MTGYGVCRVFIFKDTGVQPHLSVGLISVRQKGGLPGPPPRNPRPRIPRRPGALCKALMPGSSSGPNVSRHWGPPQACTACSRHKKIQKKIYFRNSKVWLCNLTSSGWGGMEFCLSSIPTQTVAWTLPQSQSVIRAAESRVQSLSPAGLTSEQAACSCMQRVGLSSLVC